MFAQSSEEPMDICDPVEENGRPNPVVRPNPTHADTSRTELTSMQFENLGLLCPVCNIPITPAGSTDYTTWCDGHCVMCNGNFEIKSLNNHGNPVNGTLRLHGGNFRSFERLAERPILIVVIHNTYEIQTQVAPGLSFYRPSGMFQSDVSEIRYYPRTNYTVNPDHDTTKSRITASNRPDMYLNVELLHPVSFVLDMTMLEDSMEVENDSAFLNGDCPIASPESFQFGRIPVVQPPRVFA